MVTEQSHTARDLLFNLRISTDEREMIAEVAHAHERTQADLIRLLVRRECERLRSQQKEGQRV